MSTQIDIRPHALVTGASSGIGAVFAERLAHDGYDVNIVARRRDRLEVLAENLQTSHQVNVEVIVADLSKSDDLRVVEKCIAENTALELLVNNAGFGDNMAFVQLDPDKAEELINLSCYLPKEVEAASEHKERDFDFKTFGSDSMNRFW
jgi:short-subunit dehydrogenase